MAAGERGHASRAVVTVCFRLKQELCQMPTRVLRVCPCTAFSKHHLFLHGFPSTLTSVTQK